MTDPLSLSVLTMLCYLGKTILPCPSITVDDYKLLSRRQNSFRKLSGRAKIGEFKGKIFAREPIVSAARVA